MDYWLQLDTDTAFCNLSHVKMVGNHSLNVYFMNKSYVFNVKACKNIIKSFKKLNIIEKYSS